MKNNEHIAQLIDKYLSGDLNATELAAFEELLATDSDFAKEVELEHILQNAVFDDGLLDWKNAIQLETTSIKKQKRFKILLAIATLGIVLIVLVAWFASKQAPAVTPIPEVEEQQKAVVDVVDSVSLITTKPAEIVQEPLEQEALHGAIVNDTLKNTVATPVEVKTLPVTAKLVEEAPIETPKPVRQPQASTPADPCAKVAISAEIKTTATCEGKQEGSIALSKIVGASGKCMFKLNTSLWQNTKVFPALSAGFYTVEAKDENGCVALVKSNVEVEEKICYTPEAGFNPDFETWEYKLETPHVTSISIYNKVGQLVYQAEVNDIFVWDGRDLQGQKVPLGLYKYLLESATEKKAGTVTVIY